MFSPKGYTDEDSYESKKSACGSNAYHLEHCEYVGCRPNYAACLNKIARRKEGRLEVQYADCSVAIGKKQCRALQMEREEKEAGRALFYVSRQKLRGFIDGLLESAQVVSSNKNNDHKQRRRVEADVSSSSKRVSENVSKPVVSDLKPVDSLTNDLSGGYADAINAAMREESSQAPSEKPARQGLSLIELARLRMGKPHE